MTTSWRAHKAAPDRILNGRPAEHAPGFRPTVIGAPATHAWPRRLELRDLVQEVPNRLVLELEVVLDLLGLVERRLGILAGLVGALVRDAAEDSAGMVVAPTDTGAARCALNG
jgi:hypothetical protein